MQRALRTVFVLAKLNTRRYFRDRLAIFFTVIFPLIFLFIFGSIFGKNSSVSFKVAVLNQSDTAVARQFNDSLHQQSKLFKINQKVTNFDEARQRMSRSEIDATIVLPPDFGKQSNKGYPTGQVKVYYSQNSQQAAQTLATVLETELQQMGSKFVPTVQPFTVASQQINEKSLTGFDYTFAGLLGFSIIGLGIFGPINVFPELKKQGILRRLHTTPLRVWQYFLSQMFSQAVIGLFSIIIMFAVAIAVFHLKVVGNPLEIGAFIVLGIVTILGIGLSIGGWAKNERQAAPLGNLVTFPMIFLSGTFFPRFLMPEWLQHISNFLPLSPVIDGIRLLTTEGKHLVDIGPQLGMIAIWLVIIYFIAFRVFRWE